MTIACQIVDVTAPTLLPVANITAIDMVLSCTTCIAAGIETITVNITWENQGNGTGSFYPGIIWSSGGVPVGSAKYPISYLLDPGQRIIQTFKIDLVPGIYDICPDPN